MERKLEQIKLINGYTAHVVTYFTRGDVIEIAKHENDKLKSADEVLRRGVLKITDKEGKEVENIIEFINTLPIAVTKKLDDFLAKLFEAEA